MNRGLGSFIEGKSSILGWHQAPQAATVTHDQGREGSPSYKQLQLLSQQQEQVKLGDDPAAGLSPPTQLPDLNGAPSRGNTFSEHNERTFSVDSLEAMLSEAKAMATLTEDEISLLVISKAANLIRESIELEGCLVFEAPMQPYLSQTHNNITTHRRSQSSTTSSSEEKRRSRRRSKAIPQCRLLGYSTSRASSIDEAAPGQTRVMLTESFLSKLLRRYPRGQIFNFGADGELQSESSEDDQPFSPSEAPMKHSSLLTSNSQISLISYDKPQMKSSTRQREGEALLKAFPDARSIGFVPIWDPRKDRWYAGGFIYTKDLARSFSIEQELSYLRAFGMLAMSEILRFKDLRADKAKTDALGSLSHELRSPLHGILLNAELLIDTKLDIFQGNVAHTIETCSRTLLDTVDHLLEYSRISHLSGRDGRAPSLSSNGLEVEQFGKKSLLRDSRLDHIVEEVVESVFAGFNFLHLSVKQLSDRQNGSMNSDVNANHQSDSLQAMDQLEPWMTKNGELRWSFDDVLIILSMDVRCNWGYFVNVGAIRRIVMNIFGNALKHTNRGTIKVSLTQETIRTRGRKKERVVRFTVQDTGKGISADFLKHGLFRPFSQEDPLSPGAGLGLSLVKQIATHLKGDVSIQSELGVGTIASVTLPLQQLPLSLGATPLLSDEDKVFKEQVEDLKGLRVRLLMANSDWQKAVVDICREWLHMEIIPNTPDTTVTPDLVMWSYMDLAPVQEDFQAFAKTPNVVVCSNALVAYRQSQAFKKAGSAAVFEFISQP
jgi:signal transduction histidine kinase